MVRKYINVIRSPLYMSLSTDSPSNKTFLPAFILSTWSKGIGMHVSIFAILIHTINYSHIIDCSLYRTIVVKTWHKRKTKITIHGTKFKICWDLTENITATKSLQRNWPRNPAIPTIPIAEALNAATMTSSWPAPWQTEHASDRNSLNRLNRFKEKFSHRQNSDRMQNANSDRCGE